MLENKDYCDYETSVALYELGYDCQVIHLIAEKITLYEAQKWLREVKKIDVGATWDNDEDNWFSYIKQMGFPDWSGTIVSHSCYSSYEEALSEGIKGAVKILKEESND